MQAPEYYSRLAVIGGSGAYDLTRKDLGEPISHDRPLLIETPFGKAAPVHFYRPAGCDSPVAFISRHGEKGYRITAPEVNYRANIWALKELGTERIISWSGPGAIASRFAPGSYVLPSDLIDLTAGARKSTFFEGTGLGFIRQNPVFCPELREILLEVLDEMGAEYQAQGVYAVTQGPRLETPAEIGMIAKLGGELVGMTLAPEVFLARELEICYHPCCYVANWAEGVKDLGADDPGRLFDGMLSPEDEGKVNQAVRGFGRIISLAAARIESMASSSDRSCKCARSMDRYRRSGRIGPDWRTWIDPRTDR